VLAEKTGALQVGQQEEGQGRQLQEGQQQKPSRVCQDWHVSAAHLNQSSYL